MSSTTPTQKSLKNLIPITERDPEEARRIRSLGGKSMKGRKVYKTQSCARCQLPCPLKEQGTIEKWRCKVPDVKRWILESALDPTKLDDSLLSDLFQLETRSGNIEADKDKSAEEKFQFRKDVFYAKLNLKKTILSQNLNVNVQGNISHAVITLEDLQKAFKKKQEERVNG